MAATESKAKDEIDISLENSEQRLLNVQQDLFVTYLALGGLITDESDSEDQVQRIRKMPISEFLEKSGISESTFYRWKKKPGLIEEVRLRRQEVFGLNRESALFNRAYLIAMTSRDHKAAGEMIKMLTGHFSKLELPVQRQEIKNEGESWTSLVEQRQKVAIEAEIINDPQVHEHDRPETKS